MAKKSRTSRTLILSATMGGSLGIASGMTSCIIPDKDICILAPCGDGWCGQAYGARGVGPAGSAIDIIDTELYDFPKACVCPTESERDALEAGILLECHEETTQTACEMITGCEWAEDIGNTDIDLCLPEDLTFQAAHLDIVNATRTRCEQVAVAHNIDPYPECDSQQSEVACENTLGCEWNSVGNYCEFPEETCETASIKTTITIGPACMECYLDCNIGGTEDGGDDDEDEDEGGDDGTGGEPWGDLGEMISCWSTGCAIEYELIEAIIEDPLPLLDQDTRLEFDDESTYSGLRIYSISSGELADHLGFQNNDLILEVNGYPVSNESELHAAANALLLVNSATVELRRSGVIIEREYEIAVSF